MDVERKISGYPVNNLPLKATDIFLGVRDLGSIPTTVTFTYGSLFANVSVPVTFSNTVSANAITASTLTLNQFYTPQSSNSALTVGAFCFDANYVYFGVGTNHIKRVPLQDF
jgi:hypothetical protein